MRAMADQTLHRLRRAGVTAVVGVDSRHDALAVILEQLVPGAAPSVRKQPRCDRTASAPQLLAAVRSAEDIVDIRDAEGLST